MSGLNTNNAQRRRLNLEQILSGAQYPSMGKRRTAIDGSHAGTFECIFDEGTLHGFIRWLSSPDEPLFWVKGKPGSGKSTLMKVLVTDARTQSALAAANPACLVISHFFWAAGDDMAKNIRGLLCSLIYQLFVGSGGLGEKVPVDEGGAILKPVEEWSERQLHEVLFWALSEYDIPVVIFLDGIDEVDAGDGNAKLLDLIEIFCKTEGTKVCVSSRPGKPFKARLLDKPTLKLEDVTRMEIEAYARSQLARYYADFAPGELNDQATVSRLASHIVNKARGVFLWAALALKGLESGLRSGESISQLTERLDLLEPGDVNALYIAMLKRHTGDEETHLKDAAIVLNTVLAY
ncbi:hypothetical protein B0T24DRAFT_531595, partial [Lasiosphaeria ovina]